MLPSWPIRIQLTPEGEGTGKSKEESSTDESGSAVNILSSSTQPHDHDHVGDGDDDQGHYLDPEAYDPVLMSTPKASNHHHQQQQQQPQQQQQQQQPAAAAGVQMASNSSRTEAASQNQSPQLKGLGGSKSDKLLDAKRQRRLAQNREAARKSRLRKKAYVQQLESSRMKLAQMEMDLQRARSLGSLFGAPANVSSGGGTFDLEYAKWVEDDQRLMGQLRAALQSQLSEGEVGVMIDGYMNHYDEIFRLKGEAAKLDVFNLLTGVWTTPAERCFLWIAGFKPSELLKMLLGQLEPLTEQQFMGICGLQQSCHQAEEALSQGLDQLQQSLVETISSTANVSMDPMQQMAVALAKLSNLEGFIRQADNLRQQTLHQLRRILTIRQAVKCFLMIGEYYGRLRALSSLWASCPRDQAMMNDKNGCQGVGGMQMMQQPPQIHFSPF